ncbi:hypothetical protein [Nonomuraea sp. NPDC003804]|uniref:hypothetical protein n=1 Tax=Nonomuraea sp. NPDC003804 TaxID=3154547 RepID=UPI0033AB87FD
MFLVDEAGAGGKVEVVGTGVGVVEQEGARAGDGVGVAGRLTQREDQAATGVARGRGRVLTRAGTDSSATGTIRMSP